VDFGQAAILTFVLLGLIDEAKTLVWGTNKERINVAIVNGAAVVTVFLVATSAWANEQIIGGKTLGALGWSSLVLVAVVLGGSAGGLWKVLGAVTNIGFNQPKPVKMPPVPGATQPTPPSGDDPMPDFHGANAVVDPATLRFADDV